MVRYGFNGSTNDTSELAANIQTTAAVAAAALTLAANARGMVLSRDGQLASLAETASQFGSVTKAADVTHQTLQDEITALQTALAKIQLTPGPAGKDGAAGKSAYDLARDAGYGGTLTQWLTTLIGSQGKPGEPGKPGDPGAAADMTRVAALETGLTAEITDRKAGDSGLTGRAAALEATTAAQATRLAKLEAKALTFQTRQYTTTLQINLNGTVTFPVVWPVPMADANYSVALTQGPNLTSVTFSNQTAAGVTVTAKTGALLSVGTMFTVAGLRFG